MAYQTATLTSASHLQEPRPRAKQHGPGLLIFLERPAKDVRG